MRLRVIGLNAQGRPIFGDGFGQAPGIRPVRGPSVVRFGVTGVDRSAAWYSRMASGNLGDLASALARLLCGMAASGEDGRRAGNRRWLRQAPGSGRAHWPSRCAPARIRPDAQAASSAAWLRRAARRLAGNSQVMLGEVLSVSYPARAETAFRCFSSADLGRGNSRRGQTCPMAAAAIGRVAAATAAPDRRRPKPA